jgi:citrate lyase beta subunit
LEYILITNDVNQAVEAQVSKVSRVMVDLELIGKDKRQGHLNTVISRHSIHDIENLRRVLDESQLMVRVNPINAHSKNEIDSVIDLGADVIMLPMFTTCFEVETFIELVDRRAIVNLLLETPQALVRVDEILRVDGIDEVHVGLNDLHLGLGINFMFELLSGGIVEYLASKITQAGIKFGFGGIAQLGKGMLDSSLILSEHYRLGSEMVILSREFNSNLSEDKLAGKINIRVEIQKLDNYLNQLRSLSQTQLYANKE